MSFSQRSTTFMQNKHEGSGVMTQEIQFRDVEETHESSFVAYFSIVQHFRSGTKHRLIAIEELDILKLQACLSNLQIFDSVDNGITVTMGNDLTPTGQPISNTQMIFSSKVTVYFDNLTGDIKELISLATSLNCLIELVDSSKFYKSVFISYGGKDENLVSEIYKKLKSHNINAWFFQEHKVAGQKLHRMMHQGVNSHDKVLLVCSETSLTRPGVLNEIERVLEREAAEGGADILIPFSIDNFVYGDWLPDRRDIASQIRSRVISKIDQQDLDKTIKEILISLKAV